MNSHTLATPRWHTYRARKHHKPYVRALNAQSMDLGATFDGARDIVASSKRFRATLSVIFAVLLAFVGTYIDTHRPTVEIQARETFDNLIAPQLLDINIPEPSPANQANMVEPPVQTRPVPTANTPALGPSSASRNGDAPIDKNTLLNVLKNPGNSLSQILGKETFTEDIETALQSTGSDTTAALRIRTERGSHGNDIQAMRGNAAAVDTGDTRTQALEPKYNKHVTTAVVTTAKTFDTEGMDRTLTKETISGVVRKKLSGIKFCYDRELAKDPSLQGKVTVRFYIEAGQEMGIVRDASINESTMENSNVEDCILRNVSRWTFPIPESSARVKVDYPFVFVHTR